MTKRKKKQPTPAQIRAFQLNHLKFRLKGAKTAMKAITEFRDMPCSLRRPAEKALGHMNWMDHIWDKELYK